MIEFRVLGSLEVVEGDRPVALGGPQQRALLAVLLVHRGESVSSDRLIDALWGEQAPASAVKIVQGYVSNLRRVLGDGLLVTRGGGYLLQAEPGQTDLDRFESLVAEGRRALQEGDAPTAAARLRDALGLWRGPPLADLAYESFAQAEIARLEESRLAALADRIDAELALGEHARLVGELEALVREHPLRERLVGQLMLALYRSGRQADALETYRRAREWLSELGLEPGPALRELEQSILRQDQSLAFTRTAPPDERSSRSALAVPLLAQIPPRGPSVIGREGELEELGRLLADASIPLLTVTGTGGTGKTTLAVEAARRVAAGFADGVPVAWLASITEECQFVPELARVLGIELSARESGLQTIARALRGQQRLLVLDNFEHVLAAAPAVAELLAWCPHLKVLVTSRAPLRVSLERVFHVRGLAVPGSDDESSVDALRQCPASALFIERASAVDPTFELTDEYASSIADICRYLGGLPLAIELAAGRTRVLAPDVLLSDLKRSLLDLSDGMRDAPERHHTLRSTIEWSQNLLSTIERMVFARLAVFRGSFALDGAVPVCGLRLSEVAVVDAITGLLDSSLLARARTEGSEDRFGMMETIRAYAQDQLDAAEDADQLRRRHAEYYARLAEQAEVELRGAGQLAWLARLDADLANLRAVLDWSLASADCGPGLRIAGALTTYWQVREQVPEILGWIVQALSRSCDSPALRAKVMLTGGMLAGQFKKASEARSFVDSCLVLAEGLDDRALLARCLAELAWAETSLGHYTRARVAYDRAHSIAVTSGSQLLLADVLRMAASTGICGEEEVKGVQSECLALLRSLGDRISEIDVLNNSGYWAFLHGNFDRARSLLEEALALSQSVWSASNQATIKGNLALLDLFEGNLASAQESFLDALECSRNVGDTSQMREIIVGIAAICAETGQQEMALRLATAATSDPSGQASEAEPLIRKRHLDPLRTLLDAQQWNAAETAGHAMGLDGAAEAIIEHMLLLERGQPANAQ